MKLVITKSIQTAEFDPSAEIFPLDIIKTAAVKAIVGLGKNIKNSSKLTGTRLKKTNLTTSNGAGRVLFLLKIGRGKAVLVMLRHKNDKKIGGNMSVENPKFKKALEKNIDMLLKDLKAGNYEEIDLQ